MSNLEKLQFFTKNKKPFFSLSLISSIILAYCTYKYYLKYKKKRHKYYNDRWFFSPSSNKSETASLNISLFISDLKYKVLLSFSTQNHYGGNIKISFFLIQNFKQGFSLDFNGQSIYDIEINGKLVEKIIFEKHQIYISKDYLVPGEKNSIAMKFLNVYSHETDGIKKYHDQKEKIDQIFNVFSLSTCKMFPCFPNIDLKVKFQLVLMVPNLDWDSACIFNLKERHLGSYEEGASIIERNRGQDFLFGRSENHYKLYIYEQNDQIYPYFFNFAIGTFITREFRLSNGIILKLCCRTKLKEKIDNLLEFSPLAEKGINYLENFIGKKYPWNQIELVFVNLKHLHNIYHSLICFNEDNLKRFLDQKKKIIWLFEFLKKISQVLCRTVCRITETEEFNFLEEFEQIIAWKTLLFIKPESILYFDILIKRSKTCNWLFCLSEVLGDKKFKETINSFFVRTVMFPLNQNEFSYCLQQMAKEFKQDINPRFIEFSNFNCLELNQKLKIDLVKSEKNEKIMIKGVEISHFTHNGEIIVLGMLKINLFYLKPGMSSEISEKTLNIQMDASEIPYFFPLEEENIDYPDIFFPSSQNFNCFSAVSNKQLQDNFQSLHDDLIKSQAILNIEKSFSFLNVEDFLTFCLNQIEFETNQTIMDKILHIFKKVLEKKFNFNQRLIYYDFAFKKLISRMINLKNQKNQQKSKFNENFEKLLDFLYSRESLELALAWTHKNRVFFNDPLKDHEIPMKEIDFHDFWKIMRKLFASREFSMEEKDEILSIRLASNKKKDFSNEIEKIMCDSLIMDLNNKEKIWKKSILGEWKSMEVFDASTCYFYDEMEKNDIEKFVGEFFKTAEIIFIMFPAGYCEIFIKNLKPPLAVRENFFEQYKQLMKRMENYGQIKQMVAKEIEEIQMDIINK